MEPEPTRDELLAEVVQLRDDLAGVRRSRNTSWLVSTILFVLFILQSLNNVAPGAERIPNASDALGYLAADAATLEADYRQFHQWFWVAPWMPERTWHAVSFCANSTMSRGNFIELPTLLAEGNLLRVNLLSLAGTKTEALRLRKILNRICLLDDRFYTNLDVFAPAAPIDLDVVVDGERLQPISYAVVTKRAALQLAGETVGHIPATVTKRFPITQQKTQNGQPFYFTEFEHNGTQYKGWLWGEQIRIVESVAGPVELPKLDVAPVVIQKRALGPHLDNRKIAGAASLFGVTDATNFTAPIVSADVFLHYALTTIGDGAYYDLMGFEGKTRDEIFERFGIDPGKSAELNADRRIGVYRSGVAGERPRQIEKLQGIVGLSFETLDNDDESFADVDQHPLRALENFQVKARENMFELPNALIAYFLANGAGVLVDEAPPNVATDTNIPGAFSKRLQSSISCIICHGPHEQWQPANNDLETLFASRLRLFDELGTNNNTRLPDETVIRLRNLYRGDFALDFASARTRYNRAVWATTGNYGAPGEEGRTAAVDMAVLVGSIYRDWKYNPVTTERALLEMGWKLEEGENAVDVFNTLVPDEPEPTLTDVAFEDLTIGMLKIGMDVSRVDWNLVLGTAAARAFNTQLENTETEIEESNEQ